MNDQLGLALAYWRTAAPQPKAIVYADAIEARMKGIETKDMVTDHELANAITRGASVARARDLKPASVKAEQKAEAKATKAEKPKVKQAKRKRTPAEE